MPTTYTTLLGLALPATGELSGTWGDTVNSYITQYVDAAVAGAQIISGSQTAVTLSTTNGSSLSQAGSGSTGSAQYAIIRCTGNPASLLTITAPAANKVYLVINATSTSQSVKVVGTGPTTGVTVAASRAALIAWNGSDFVLIATTDIAQMSGFGTGVATALGQNVTGSGGIVLATSPTLVTPTLGAASATSVALAAGAAGTPSLTATGDLDTGFWFPAANTLAASTGGTERLRIDSTGKVGIGTTSPTYALDVQTSTVVTQARFGASATGGATILSGGGSQGIWCGGCDYNGTAFVARATTSSQMRTDGGLIIFYTDSSLTSGNTFTPTERLRITEGGNVGIGTTVPAGKFNVVGDQVIVAAGTGTSSFGIQIKGSALTSVPAAQTQAYIATGDSAIGTAGDLLIAPRTDVTANIRFITGTSPSERMRIDSSGNVGIGTTSPASKLQVVGNTITSNLYFGNGSGSAGTVGADSGNSGARIELYGSTAGNANAAIFLNSGGERMRITSNGDLLKGVTTFAYGSTADAFQISSGNFVVLSKASTADVNQIVFNNGNGQVGYINTSGTGTTYSTSSDYRLKENVRPMTGALSKIAALKPVTYTWKTDGSNGQGFIAHELQEVVPECVSGQKDAVDENGKPRYQGIDTSFLVATLTAAIQEQQAIIKSLTDRIAALEAKGA